MCQIVLCRCATHNHLRGFILARCDEAVAASGLPQSTGQVVTNKLPRFTAEEGCDAPPEILSHVEEWEECPPDNYGSRSACRGGPQ